ncbi:MAG: hypothetical protein GKS03_15660 [Alphaproteobacteria bacterium]|nr:hypothetical protein [Alphaproteobacteria bacterium]
MPKTHAAAFDKRGLIYAANDSGLLSFDGNEWRIHPAGIGKLPLKVLAPLEGGAWLAGSTQQLGVFAPMPNGTLKWTSVKNEEADGQSDEILALIPDQSEIYVITDRAISTWKNGAATRIFSGLPTGLAFISKGNLVASIEDGLIIFNESGWRELDPPPGWDDLEPIGILPGEGDNPILITKRSGLFSVVLAEDQLSLSPLWDILPIPLESVSLSTGAIDQDGRFLLGTETGAIFHLDRQGNPLRVIEERSGFRGGAIRTIITNTKGNAFAFHDGEMIWFDATNEYRVWDETNGLANPVTAITVDAATTYVGTSVGLFRSLSGGRMRHVENAGILPIHTLNRFARSSMKGHTSLLLGRENGVFEFFDGVLTEIASDRAAALFISRTQPSRIAIGAENLVRLFEFDRGEWLDIGFLGRPTDAHVSDFAETGEGDLLIAFTDGSVARYAADDWLGEGNLHEVEPLDTQSFPRRIKVDTRPQFASHRDEIHLFASGAALRWDYRTTRFSTDTALTTELALLFGADQPRWLAASRDKEALWFQTNRGTFRSQSEDQTLIQLPDIAAGTDRHSTIFLDSSLPRALIGTPDGLLSLPTSLQRLLTNDRTSDLMLRGIFVDGESVYGGDGAIGSINISAQTKKVVLGFSILDWKNRCDEHNYVAEVGGLNQGFSYLPVDHRCRVTLDLESFKTERSPIEIRLTRNGTPATTKQMVYVQINQPWFMSSSIPYTLAALFAAAALAGGLKTRRVWPEPLRRYLALLSGLLLCLAVTLTLGLILPPGSLPDLGLWILGLAVISLVLPLFAEALMRLSDRRSLSR